MGETDNRINSYKDLRVYQNSMDSAMEIFQLTKVFPSEEKLDKTYNHIIAQIVLMINDADKWLIR
ncbi:MAG: hypothetical protein MAG551_00247 [Candidatus Scalindua arabica]|uniref:Four helix bundle protein n=1 Tax=Candidatus Scalindua arabica TaxID=1127984 RepID=A0A941W151_9BACT|nr:hypothetical protein [Candidatus Scalindua arabica]